MDCHRSVGGFTLIEIMVVMLILGLLVALVGPQLIGQGEGAKVQAAKTQIKSIEEAVTLFKLQVGRFPSTAEGLEALMPPGPSDARGRFEPEGYLKRIPLDPWQHPYVYRSDGRSLVVVSYGADGQPGGEGRDADLHSD
jgi:general secretion pathway protein G